MNQYRFFILDGIVQSLPPHRTSLLDVLPRNQFSFQPVLGDGYYLNFTDFQTRYEKVLAADPFHNSTAVEYFQNIAGFETHFGPRWDEIPVAINFGNVSIPGLIPDGVANTVADIGQQPVQGLIELQVI